MDTLKSKLARLEREKKELEEANEKLTQKVNILRDLFEYIVVRVTGMKCLTSLHLRCDITIQKKVEVSSLSCTSASFSKTPLIFIELS